MYIPASFDVSDPAVLSEFIRRYSFAVLVSHDGQQSQASHLPMLLAGQAVAGSRLLCHLARANPQWRHLTPQPEVLCIFTGPHTYISPSLYAPGPNVPTWNYTAVHVYGTPRIIDGAELPPLLDQLVAQYESARQPAWVDTNPAEYRQQLLQAIVGLEITITRIEGKFKLNQNKPQEIPRVISGLAASPHPDDQAVAQFMKERFQ